MIGSTTSSSGCAVVDAVVADSTGSSGRNRSTTGRRTIPALAGVIGLAIVLIASIVGSGTVSAAEPTVARGRFIAVGDSILLGARSQLESRTGFLGWPAVLDLEVSRSTSAGAAALESHHPGPGDVVLISLGANDSGNPDLFRSRAEGVALAAAGASSVYWLTIAEVRPYYTGTNTIIRELAERHPNMNVVDWAAVAAADLSLTAGDGLHLTPRGTVAMADEIFRTIMGGVAPAPAVITPWTVTTETGPAPAPSTVPGPDAAPSITAVPTPTGDAPASSDPASVDVAEDTVADRGTAPVPSKVPVDRLVSDTSAADRETSGDVGGGRGPLMGLGIGIVAAGLVLAAWSARRRRGGSDLASSHTEEQDEQQKT